MPGFSGAVGAAVDRAIRFYTMPDDPGPTTGADGSEHVYRALEAVEYVRSASHYDLEGIVVLVTANLASSHTHYPAPSTLDSLTLANLAALAPESRRCL